jgi:molybdate transport system ATP-binding protein
VGIVGNAITGAALSVRVRKARSAEDGSPFVLDVALEIIPGVTIVFGPSGAGKSTLLDCIAGLLRPDAGKISIGANVLLDTERGRDVPPAKRQIAYVFQSLALFPHMTVQQNAAYGLAKMPEPHRAHRVHEMLQAFRVEQLAARKPGELSGGERQRVALARSLATTPRVLLLTLRTAATKSMLSANGSLRSSTGKSPVPELLTKSWKHRGVPPWRKPLDLKMS